MTTPENPLGEIDQTSYAARLIAAREARQLSVEDVAAQLNLHRSVLEALETERHDLLPTPAFVRGYLRGYARLLGIDGDELVREYSRSGVQDPVPVAMAGHDVEQPRSSHPLMRWATMGIVALLIALLIAWLLTRDGGVLSGDDQPPEQSATDAPATSTAGGDALEALIEPLPAPAAAQRGGEAAPAGFTGDAGDGGAGRGLPLVVPAGEPGADEFILPGVVGDAGDDTAGVFVVASGEDAAGTLDGAQDGAGDADVGVDPAAPAEAHSGGVDDGDAAAGAGDASDASDADASQGSDSPAEADASGSTDDGASAERAATATATDDLDADLEAEPLQPLQPVPAASDGTDLLELRSVEDSWAEITDSEGERLMFDLLRGDEPRRLIGVAPFEVFLGNAPTVELKVNGIAVEPPKISSRNTARFEVSADGVLR